MVMVKMNNTTVECSIAASELRELGLTPEAVINEDKISLPFMTQLGQEVGAQLGYNPETEVLMMTKNLMGDGSLRVFAMKMTDEDIERSTERMRSAAEEILKITSKRRIAAIKRKKGQKKGMALNKLMGEIGQAMAGAYGADIPIGEPQIEAMSRRISSTECYMARFDKLEECVRFARAVEHFPIAGSKLYKDKGRYWLILTLVADVEARSYELRCIGLEYAKELQMGSAELTHIEETAECLIAKDAIQGLKEFGDR